MYAPQVALYQNQNFAVAIEDDTLTLVVENSDGSKKKLPVSATIPPAAPLAGVQAGLLEKGLLRQPVWQCVFQGETIAFTTRFKDAPQDERQWIVNAVATKLLDGGLASLFPGNKHIQYAE
jgi:hypothetical protein